MASENVWQNHAALFRRLFLEQNKTLKQVKSEAEEIYGFPAHSLSAYETNFREQLRLRKNLTPEGWVAIGQHIKAIRHPNWDVYFYGKHFEKSKVMKEISRYEKRGTYAANLALPLGIEIRQPDLVPTHSTGTVAGIPAPQQTVSPVSSGPVFQDQGIECFQVVDFESRISFGSPSNDLISQEIISSIINPTVEIVVAVKNAISNDFSAAILDSRLEDLWHPMLNGLPIRTLNPRLRQFVSDKPASSLDTSMIPTSQTTLVQTPGTWLLNSPLLGADLDEILRSFDPAATSIEIARQELDDMDDVYGYPSDSKMSTDFDPFQILGLMMFHLSNHLERLEEISETIRFFMEQVPQHLVDEFLQAGSPAIEACWMPLAEWSFEFHQKRFFEQIMQASLRCTEWVELYGVRCLVFAAYFGCSNTVRNIIACGVSPDEPSQFELLNEYDNDQAPDFSGLAAAEWRRSIRVSYNDGSKLVETFPLVEAAARSNLEVIGILKDVGVDSQLRSGGLTAAGHALNAYERGAMDKDELFATLSVLIAMGESIDAPVWEEWRCGGGNSRTCHQWSEETLLDAIYIRRGGSSSFQNWREHSRVPDGVLTVSGILQSAAGGRDALRRYMATNHYPSGLPRERIKDIALIRSLELPTAFESMTENGFSLELKALVGGDNMGFDGDSSLPQLHDHASDFLLGRLRSVPDSVAQYIIDWLREDRIGPFWDEPDVETIKFLVPKLKPSQIERFGLSLLKSSARNGSLAAVKTCLEAGISCREIDLLQLAKSNGLRSGDTSILELLYEYGARPVFSPQFLQGMSHRGQYDIKELRWLVSHGIILDGLSIYDIMLLFNFNPVSRTELHDFGQCLGERGYSLFTWPPSTSRFRQGETCHNPISLALLICLGGTVDLISRLLGKGGLHINRSFVVGVDGAMRMPLPLSILDWNSELPLESAVIKGDVPMIQTLLDHGANINGHNIWGQAVLEKSVGLCVQAPNPKAKAACKQTIDYLLENDADVNGGVSEMVSSPSLVLAVLGFQPDLQLIKLLIEKGARVGQSSSRSRDSLIRSLFVENIDFKLKQEIFELLNAHGAPYISSEELVVACLLGDIQLVQFHLQKGANPNVLISKTQLRWRDTLSEYRSPHDVSLRKRLHSPFLQWQLDESDGPEVRPLEASAKSGNIPIALVLLAAGATLSGGDNSLWRASRNGRLDMVALLLPHEKRRDEVEKALESALVNRYYSIIRLLRQRLAEWTSES